jgi:excisionase family DNA binding protein
MLTIKEIASELKVTERTVRRWIAEGKLKSEKIQGIRRIKPEDYLEFLKNN